MGIEEKLANAKKTRWLAEGFTDEEIKEARENAKKVKKQENEDKGI